MTYETRTADEIERDIERDRAQLTSNIETLQDQFSLDGMIGQVGDQLRQHGGEITRSITRTVKENPAAVALTGIGLAWMIFGNKSGHKSDYSAPSDSRGYAFAGSRPSGAYAAPGASVSRPDPRFKGGNVGLPSWANDDEDELSYADKAANVAADLRDGVADKASAAADRLRQSGHAVQEKTGDVKSGIAGGISSAKDSAASTAQGVKDRAERLRARIAEGTENLPEEARRRVIMARENAIMAKRKAAAAVAQSADKAADLYERQPLIAGALALAVGAAIGTAAPRTRKEDELLGAHSDKLMQDAERIFHEEVEKARSVVSAAKNEVKTIAQEKRDDLNSGAPGDQTAVEAVVKEAKKAGDRVAKAAKSKAEEEKLGKVS